MWRQTQGLVNITQTKLRYLANIRFAALLAIAATLSSWWIPATASEKCGLLDGQGKWIIPPKYAHIEPLGKDRYYAFRVKRRGGQENTIYGFVFDHNGNAINFPLPEGFALRSVLMSEADADKISPEIFLEIEKDDLAGVCDTSGKIIVEPKYHPRFTYNEGCFIGWSGDCENNVFLARNGEPLAKVPARWCSIAEPFREGLVKGLRSSPDGPEALSRSLVFFHPDGTVAPLGRMGDGLGFSEGYAAVSFVDENGKFLHYGFIDKSGKLLGDKKFDYCQSMHNGEAIVGELNQSNQKLKYGTVNRSGSIVIQPKYDSLRFNDASSYIATLNDSDTLIDRKGAPIFRLKEKVKLTNSDTPFLQAEFDCYPATTVHPKCIAFVDRAGHMFTNTSWPVAGMVAPVYVQEDDGYWAGLRDGKKWLTERKFHSFKQLPDNRWVGCYESKNFDKDEWKSREDRLDQVHKLLRQYDLIGMPRKQVEDLLGLGDSNTEGLEYFVKFGTCTEPYLRLLIKFQNERVASWSIGPYPTDARSRNGRGLQPVEFTKNVVFKDGKYVKKS